MKTSQIVFAGLAGLFFVFGLLTALPEIYIPLGLVVGYTASLIYKKLSHENRKTIPKSVTGLSA